MLTTIPNDMVPVERPFVSLTPLRWPAWGACFLVLLVAGMPFGGRTLLEYAMGNQRDPENFRVMAWVYCGVGLLIELIWLTTCFYARWLLGTPYGRKLPLQRRVWYSGTAHFQRRPLDVRLWLEETGPDGPRVLLNRVEPFPILAVSEVHEEVDIMAIRAASVRRTRKPWLLIGFYALMALMMWGIGHKSGNFFHVGLYGFMIVILILSYGIFNIPIRSVMASVRRVEVGGVAGMTSFTRADSVMLLSKAGRGEWLIVQFLRTDGRAAHISFTGGVTTPALHELLARWSTTDSTTRPGSIA